MCASFVSENEGLTNPRPKDLAKVKYKFPTLIALVARHKVAHTLHLRLVFIDKFLLTWTSLDLASNGDADGDADNYRDLPRGGEYKT